MENDLYLDNCLLIKVSEQTNTILTDQIQDEEARVQNK